MNPIYQLPRTYNKNNDLILNYKKKCYVQVLNEFPFILPGNGFIEGSELDGFLREFVTSVNSSDTAPEVSIINLR